MAITTMNVTLAGALVTGALLLGACGDEMTSAAPLRSGSLNARGTITGTGASGLRVREKPTTAAAVITTLADGAVVDISCRAQGESVNGNRAWDYLASEHGYVADAFVETDPTANIPACNTDTAADAGTASVPAEVDIDGPPVRPHVQLFANEACRAAGACRASTYAGHEPSADLALDFPISEAFGKLPTDDYAFGDRVADFAISDMARYRIDYVIYRQRINMGSGWEPMEDRGSITENHLDHVHVSFKP